MLSGRVSRVPTRGVCVGCIASRNSQDPCIGSFEHDFPQVICKRYVGALHLCGVDGDDSYHDFGALHLCLYASFDGLHFKYPLSVLGADGTFRLDGSTVIFVVYYKRKLQMCRAPKSWLSIIKITINIAKRISPHLSRIDGKA